MVIKYTPAIDGTFAYKKRKYEEGLRRRSNGLFRHILETQYSRSIFYDNCIERFGTFQNHLHQFVLLPPVANII